MRRHKCGRVCIWCLAQSAAFPIEHFIWEKLPGLSWITVHILGV